MIAIQLEGQLGNQLFQIAFIRSAAKKLKERYIILDDTAYGNLVEKYFHIRWYERKLFRKILLKSGILKFRGHITCDNWTMPEKIMDNLKPDMIYQGFFQSQKFFKDTISLGNFRIKNKYRKEFKKKYFNNFKEQPFTVIHIRLKDYLEFGNEKLGGKGLNLPFTYYQNAIEKICFKPGDRLYVISDDVEFVRKNLKLAHPFTIEENPSIIDLLLMVNAKNLVLSNSSFSWWGAYLNSSMGSKIITPEYWLGFKVSKTYPVDIFCEEWKRVKVNTDNS